MYYLDIIIKLIVGLSILNVWLLNRDKGTQWRGGNADSMEEEFKAYGLSKNVMILTGIVKCLAAVALIASIFYLPLEAPAAYTIAGMMLIAIIMHIKISDPIKKSLPAFIFLVLSLATLYI